MRVTTFTAGLAAFAGLAQAIDLDLNDRNSVLGASKTIANNVLAVYNRNGTGPAIPGLLPDPYYWWHAGIMFDSLINYWSLSGDDSIVPTIQQGLLFQRGPQNSYMPPNQTKSEGNDDQAVWAAAAMSAAELGLPMPANSSVTWVQLAQNVFNAQAARWDNSTCGGGLRWQIFTFNNGYNYKNSETMAGFVQLAARLHRFTGNATYGDWAQKGVEWTESVGLIDTSRGALYDGTSTETNCSQLSHLQWTQNYGWFLGGAAYEENVTSTKLWTGLSFALLTNANQTFTANGSQVLRETACEPSNNCNTDQFFGKGILARGLARQIALTMNSNTTVNGTSIGSVHQQINNLLRTSAQAAAAQCTGGRNGTQCGSKWTLSGGKNDGEFGVGQDLSALEVILATLPSKALKNANGTTTNSTVSTGSTGSTSSTSQNSNGTPTGTGAPASRSSNVATTLSTTTLVSAAGFGLTAFVLAFL